MRTLHLLVTVAVDVREDFSEEQIVLALPDLLNGALAATSALTVRVEECRLYAKQERGERDVQEED